MHGVTYGYVFPSVASGSQEFIGEIVAPLANAWVGVSPGGAMLHNLLLVAWPNAGKIVRSARYTESVFFVLHFMCSKLNLNNLLELMTCLRMLN